MKKLLNILFENFALLSIGDIFTHDAHNIVSKRGWEILNKNKTNG